ncbi:hypothetical protein F5Y13DRAFT_203256 [Hypoxylon sp. FL1857]|nr:hypothetical protein F5Y13DRAFT_203256 [Hypoxylon sp. FL1857]
MSISEARRHPVYGKYDFGRFERLEGSIHYIGQGNIGDVEAACKFLFRESRWGVLTQDKNPGGIVYLDLTFTEPLGCRLKSATVLLTLDEEDEGLRHHFSAESSSNRAKVPVQITKYGPQILLGQIDQVIKTTKHHLTPRLEVGGFAGAGGVGRDSEKHYVQQSQWKLSGVTSSNKLGKPTILRWDLVESEFDHQPRHDNTFHTAFAFEHDGQPFLMQVEVSGELEGMAPHMWHKVKKKFKKFKFPTEPKTATTLVNFCGRNNPYQTPLDELAGKIPREMVERNTKLVARVPLKPSNTDVTEEEENPGTEQDDPPDPQQRYPSQGLDEQQSTTIGELREEALALIFVGGPTINQNVSVQMSDIPPTNHQQPVLSHDSSLTPGNQAGNSAVSATLLDERRGEAAREVALTVPHANYEEVRKLLQESPLPAVFQLIILWILAVAIRMSPPSPPSPPSKTPTLPGKKTM